MAVTGINNDYILMRDLTDLECIALSKEEILQLYRNCYKILTDILKQDESQKESIEDHLLASHLEHMKFIEWFHENYGAQKYLQIDNEPRKYITKIGSVYESLDEIYPYWQKQQTNTFGLQCKIPG